MNFMKFMQKCFEKRTKSDHQTTKSENYTVVAKVLANTTKSGKKFLFSSEIQRT